MTRLLLVATLLSPGLAFACGGATKMADADEKTEEIVANVDPTHCAKQGELVGANCSYATGMMAQRVLEQGKSYTFTGSLVTAGNKLDSRVAAPYTVGPEGSINIVANEVIETLVDAGAANKRLELAGKLLEVDGVTYFVATQFETVNS